MDDVAQFTNVGDKNVVKMEATINGLNNHQGKMMSITREIGLSVLHLLTLTIQELGANINDANRKMSAQISSSPIKILMSNNLSKDVSTMMIVTASFVRSSKKKSPVESVSYSIDTLPTTKAIAVLDKVIHHHHNLFTDSELDLSIPN